MLPDENEHLKSDLLDASASLRRIAKAFGVDKRIPNTPAGWVELAGWLESHERIKTDEDPDDVEIDSREVARGHDGVYGYAVHTSNNHDWKPVLRYFVVDVWAGPDNERDMIVSDATVATVATQEEGEAVAKAVISALKELRKGKADEQQEK